jgi:hypothetical protein
MVALTKESEANTDGFSVGDASANMLQFQVHLLEAMPHFRLLYAACRSIPDY